MVQTRWTQRHRPCREKATSCEGIYALNLKRANIYAICLDIVILTTSTGIIFHLDRSRAAALINKKSNNRRRRKSAWPWMLARCRALSDCLMLIYQRRSSYDTIWILFITPPDTLASRTTGLPRIITPALQRGIELGIDWLRHRGLFVDSSALFNKILFWFHACVAIVLHHLFVSF